MSTTARHAQVSESSYDQPTGWTGWITFAAVMMIIAGSLNALYGVIAAVNDDWVVWTNLARTLAVIVASISLLVNFFFIPVYPLWALTVITIDALVIWAVTAHGREMREA
jgi:hypothetical protein